MIKHIFQWKRPNNGDSNGYDGGVRTRLYSLSKDLSTWKFKTVYKQNVVSRKDWYDSKEFLEYYTTGSIRIHYE